MSICCIAESSTCIVFFCDLKKKKKVRRDILRHERPGKKSRKLQLPLSQRWRTCVRTMGFPAVGERKECGQGYQSLKPNGRGGHSGGEC